MCEFRIRIRFFHSLNCLGEEDTTGALFSLRVLFSHYGCPSPITGPFSHYGGPFKVAFWSANFRVICAASFVLFSHYGAYVHFSPHIVTLLHVWNWDIGVLVPSLPWPVLVRSCHTPYSIHTTLLPPNGPLFSKHNSPMTLGWPTYWWSQTFRPEKPSGRSALCASFIVTTPANVTVSNYLLYW